MSRDQPIPSVSVGCFCIEYRDLTIVVDHGNIEPDKHVYLPVGQPVPDTAGTPI